MMRADNRSGPVSVAASGRRPVHGGDRPLQPAAGGGRVRPRWNEWTDCHRTNNGRRSAAPTSTGSGSRSTRGPATASRSSRWSWPPTTP